MIKQLILIGAILAGMAVPAAAQVGFHLSFGKQRHGRSFQISVGSHHHHRRVPRYETGYRRDRGHRHNRGRRYGRGGYRLAARGGYRYVTQRVWVPGCRRRVYVPARYGYRVDWCGRRVRYCITQAHYDFVQEPGRWENQRRRVWVAY